MTERRRILLNVGISYGREFYALVLGLFTCRWTLAALGHIDYGLFSLVGGLSVFVGFLNGLFAESVSRFFSFAVGKGALARDARETIEDCRAWFSIALMLHTVIPLVMTIIGYPIGLWVVKHWLVIPPDRVEACIWLWRFACVSCFAGVIGVPFRAMFCAKQEIAEFTVYYFAVTTFLVCFVWHMSRHPGDWLVGYGACMCGLVVAPAFLIAVRAVVRYPECRFRLSALREGWRYRELAAFAGSRALSAAAQLIAEQGASLVVNRLLGPVRNAALTVGHHVTTKTLTLREAVGSALQPAIVNAVGAGDMRKVRRLALRTDVFCPLAIAVFAIPMILEMDEVMKLWLGTPPQLAGDFCRFWLIAYMIDQMTMGHAFALLGKGRILFFQIGEAVGWILAWVVSWVAIRAGTDILGVGLGWCVMFTLDDILKIVLGRRQMGLSVRSWCRRVFLPFSAIVALAFGAGFVARAYLPPSFLRVVITTLSCEIVFLPLVWRWVLAEADRAAVRARLGMGA